MALTGRRLLPMVALGLILPALASCGGTPGPSGVSVGVVKGTYGIVGGSKVGGHGSVCNGITNCHVPGVIMLHSSSFTKSVSVPPSGRFTVQLPPGAYKVKTYCGTKPLIVSAGTTVTLHLLCQSPTVTTSLSSTDVRVGTPVHDSAKLLDFDVPAATGVVSYFVNANHCQFATGLVKRLPVTHGVLPDSPGVRFSHSGTYYWLVIYSGDRHNPSAMSTCGAEVVRVRPRP